MLTESHHLANHSIALTIPGCHVLSVSPFNGPVTYHNHVTPFSCTPNDVSRLHEHQQPPLVSPADVTVLRHHTSTAASCKTTKMRSQFAPRVVSCFIPDPPSSSHKKVSWRGCEKTFIGVDVKEGLDGEQGGATPQKHTALSSSLFFQTRKHGPESVKEGVNGMRSHTSPRRSGYLPCLCLSFLVISGRKLSGK